MELFTEAEKAMSCPRQQLTARIRCRQALEHICRSPESKRVMGYFAPKCARQLQTRFELHYPDGRVEYELPSVSSAAAGLRIAGLLDNIGRTQYDVLREHLVKMLALSSGASIPR